MTTAAHVAAPTKIPTLADTREHVLSAIAQTRKAMDIAERAIANDHTGEALSAFSSAGNIVPLGQKAIGIHQHLIEILHSERN